ncbi:serine hydrolase domain-containing protein [Dokdonella sp.]|uniref:serine hydrolase domain-containing protein n=1 Tax=Dokdonella sp. TaxID=2291710 RepID=UPI001B115E14|nr:serine hydrolase domain-containing protein [Dokdonella sp.]MBO9661661.1 beta-lactamase family protein [Dokdonella sp.]
MKLFLSLVVLLLAHTAPARAAVPEAFIEAYAKQHGFSGSIRISRPGKPDYARSFGLANLAFEVPNRTQTKYKIASITKLFTATLILQLREQGKLDLERPIRTYLTDYTGRGGDTITVHQLLNHTSGLPNFDRVTDAADAIRNGLPTYQKPYTSDQLLVDFCSGDPVHAPGTTFDYNNGDYVVLGKIIERLYGAPYERVLKEKILDPLRMKDSGFLHQSDVVAGLADTYFYRDDLKALSPDLPAYPENWYAAGALYSTTADLARFAQALFGRKLLRQESLDRMFTPGLDDYGYGLWSYDTKLGGVPRRVVKRPGRIMGAQAQLFHVFDPDLTIVVLANTGAADLDEFVARIAERAVE